MRPAAGIGETQLHDFVHGDAGLDLVHRVKERFDGNGVPGVHHYFGFLVGVEPTPLRGVGVRGERVVLTAFLLSIGEKQPCQKQSHCCNGSF
jgi:hypothetical protein